MVSVLIYQSCEVREEVEFPALLAEALTVIIRLVTEIDRRSFVDLTKLLNPSGACITEMDSSSTVLRNSSTFVLSLFN